VAKLRSQSQHLTNVGGPDEIGRTINSLLKAQSTSIPPVLAILIGIFCFLLGTISPSLMDTCRSALLIQAAIPK
jgi:hypothetical protein